MVKHLSGWARVWIVSALVVWAVGGWWLSQNWPSRRFVLGASFDCARAYNTEDGYIGGAFVEGCQFSEDVCRRMYASCMEQANSSEVIAFENAERERASIEYYYEVGRGVGALAVTPFVLGAIGLLALRVGRWVRRGFSPSGPAEQ